MSYTINGDNMEKNNGYLRRTMKKKNAILNACESLLIKKGPNSTSIAEIAKVAKVSQVSIYNYFGSKIALIKTVLDRYMNKMINTIDDILYSNEPFKDKIDKLIKLQITDAIANSMFSDVDWNNKAIIELLEDYSNKYSPNTVFKICEQGKEEGYIDPNIPNEAVFDYVTTLTTLFLSKSLKKETAYRNGLYNLFFYGLIGRKSD